MIYIYISYIYIFEVSQVGHNLGSCSFMRLTEADPPEVLAVPLVWLSALADP